MQNLSEFTVKADPHLNSLPSPVSIPGCILDLEP